MLNNGCAKQRIIFSVKYKHRALPSQNIFFYKIPLITMSETFENNLATSRLVAFGEISKQKLTVLLPWYAAHSVIQNWKKNRLKIQPLQRNHRCTRVENPGGRLWYLFSKESGWRVLDFVQNWVHPLCAYLPHPINPLTPTPVFICEGSTQGRKSSNKSLEKWLSINHACVDTLSNNFYDGQQLFFQNKQERKTLFNSIVCRLL